MANKKQSGKSVSKLLVVVLGLLLVGGVAYWWQKTKVATGSRSVVSANWETYTNSKYDFSIGYPTDWSYREFSDSKDGAAFNPISEPGFPDKSDAISVSAGQKLGGEYRQYSLEEYAKVAGAEIQNYDELASIKKVVSADGSIGYQTTWMVSPMGIMGQPPVGGPSESLPITYFALPGDDTSLLRIYLEREEELEVYEAMIKTLKFSSPKVSPSVDETEVLKSVVRKTVSARSGGDGSNLSVTISLVEGNYAKGMISETGGGGIWFAAKKDGVWKLVWDGNGIIQCTDLVSYPNFPTDLIPQCWNEVEQEMTTR